MSEERLADIETKIAYQERLIKDLNDVLFEQQREIERVSGLCALLAKQYNEIAAIVPAINAPANDRPPHY